MLDVLIVLVFVVYAIAAGLRARRQASQGLDEYFLAGRSIKGWKAGVSMAATQFAADTPLLVTGLIATSGIFALWRLWIYALAFLLLAFVFAALWRRSGVLTDAELTELRYSGKGALPLRVLKAIYFGTVINCAVMAMVLVAAVRIAEILLPWQDWLPAGAFGVAVGIVDATGLRLGRSVTGLPDEIATASALISILLMLSFTTLYSTTGGLRSVIATDVVQFGLMMGGTALYAGYAVAQAGGLRDLSRRVEELYPGGTGEQMLSFVPPAGELVLPFIAIVALQWIFQMNSDGTGYLAQRAMACQTDREARIAGVVFTWLQWFARSLVWLLIALALLVIYPYSAGDAAAEGFTAGRELLFVTGAVELLPTGVRGIMFTALLAALASTIDTHLNWGASYWSNDVYRRAVCGAWLRREPSSRELVVIARLSNILILGVALAIMANLGSIQEAWTLSLLFGAGMGSVLVMRWLWERINLYSEIAAILTSLAAAPVLLATVATEWVRLGLMAMLTTIAAVGITWLTPPTGASRLRHFYLKVQPVGFWGQTARAAGADPGLPRRRLVASLVTLAACAASLYLLLVGVAMLMLPGRPGAGWITGLAMAAVGLGLVPLWWRRGFREQASPPPGAAGADGRVRTDARS
jgi:solute:Na+ symporter, SSS family